MIRGIIYNYKVVNSPVQQISSNGKEGNENKTKNENKNMQCFLEDRDDLVLSQFKGKDRVQSEE